MHKIEVKKTFACTWHWTKQTKFLHIESSNNSIQTEKFRFQIKVECLVQKVYQSEELD